MTLQRATSHVKRKKTRKERNRHITQFTFLLAVFLFFDSKFHHAALCLARYHLYLRRFRRSRWLKKRKMFWVLMFVLTNLSADRMHKCLKYSWRLTNSQQLARRRCVRSTFNALDLHCETRWRSFVFGKIVPFQCSSRLFCLVFFLLFTLRHTSWTSRACANRITRLASRNTKYL